MDVAKGGWWKGRLLRIVGPWWPKVPAVCGPLWPSSVGAFRKIITDDNVFREQIADDKTDGKTKSRSFQNCVTLSSLE